MDELKYMIFPFTPVQILNMITPHHAVSIFVKSPFCTVALSAPMLAKIENSGPLLAAPETNVA